MDQPVKPAESALLAGAAVGDITPRGRVFLYGYPHEPRYSHAVHDPLQCAALFLANDSASALFLAHDLIGLTREFVANARARISAATGISEGSIMLTATHTHSGPVTVNYLSNAADHTVPAADTGYLAWLADRIVATAVAARQSAVPAEIGLAIAQAQGVGTNRHDPAGPADPAVPVLLTRCRATQRPVGCMVVYAMHPTVLHEDSTFISGDFPYFTREYLHRRHLPRTCPVIYHSGAAGNQSPRHVAQANTLSEARRLGENLGRAIAAVLPTITFQREIAISHARQFLELEPRAFPPAAEAEAAVHEMRSRLDSLRKSGVPRQAVRTVECDVFGAEETAELARAAVDGRLAGAVRACSPAEVQVIQIGRWRFVGWPGEFFVEYALAVKAQAPDTFPITLANGEVQGYIVTPEAAEKRVYESTNAIFAAANGQRFVEAALNIIHHRS